MFQYSCLFILTILINFIILINYDQLESNNSILLALVDMKSFQSCWLTKANILGRYLMIIQGFFAMLDNFRKQKQLYSLTKYVTVYPETLPEEEDETPRFSCAVRGIRNLLWLCRESWISDEAKSSKKVGKFSFVVHIL